MGNSPAYRRRKGEISFTRKRIIQAQREMRRDPLGNSIVSTFCSFCPTCGDLTYLWVGRKTTIDAACRCRVCGTQLA